MKTISILSLIVGLSLGATAFAAPSKAKTLKSPMQATPYRHMYIGAILGATETHYSKKGFDNTSTNKAVENGTVVSSGFGQRVMLGYRYNPYLGVEGGYTRYGTTNANHLHYSGGSENVSGEITESSFDLSGKLIYPASEEMDIFAKLGVAELMSRIKTDDNFSKDRNITTFGYGLGVAFNMTKKFAIDASIQRIQGRGRVESADLMGLGFYYNFFQ